ncbi:hypothetical protein KUV73_23650 [Mameliella alba]|nr:hypothetical protein [Mameliella alba]MBY6177385.1 hypothetical protein [Mameliella alba]
MITIEAMCAPFLSCVAKVVTLQVVAKNLNLRCSLKNHAIVALCRIDGRGSGFGKPPPQAKFVPGGACIRGAIL